MLRLSKKTDYAIILLSYLATSESPASAQEMACRYHLPQPMVANILKQLASAGIIESKRGQQGGYRLAKVPSELTLASIVRITDSQFSLVECAHDDDGCKISSWCPTRNPLQALHSRIEEFMESLTLDQITTHPQFNCSRRNDDEVAYLS